MLPSALERAVCNGDCCTDTETCRGDAGSQYCTDCPQSKAGRGRGWGGVMQQPRNALLRADLGQHLAPLLPPVPPPQLDTTTRALATRCWS